MFASARSDEVWRRPPPRPSLGGDQVHVWYAALEAAPPLPGCLSPDEVERAERFVFARDRRRFAAARTILRTVLGRYAGVEPRALRFRYNRFGKPYLPAAGEAAALTFNLAHSGDRALLAVAAGREVGVDIEQVRPDVPSRLALDRILAPAEAAAFRSLPPERAARAFFTLWTRKEAYVKARGEGISIPLHTVDVSLLPGSVAAAAGDASDGPWSLRDLHPEPGYAAAVAAHGHGWQLACWLWPGQPGTTCV